MSMVSGVVGGVDTHADVRVAAAVDTSGGVLGIESFPTDAGGVAGQRADAVTCVDAARTGGPLAERFPEALQRVLEALGVVPAFVEVEISMQCRMVLHPGTILS